MPSVCPLRGKQQFANADVAVRHAATLPVPGYAYRCPNQMTSESAPPGTRKERRERERADERWARKQSPADIWAMRVPMAEPVEVK